MNEWYVGRYQVYLLNLEHCNCEFTVCHLQYPIFIGPMILLSQTERQITFCVPAIAAGLTELFHGRLTTVTSV